MHTRCSLPAHGKHLEPTVTSDDALRLCCCAPLSLSCVPLIRGPRWVAVGEVVSAAILARQLSVRIQILPSGMWAEREIKER